MVVTLGPNTEDVSNWGDSHPQVGEEGSVEEGGSLGVVTEVTGGGRGGAGHVKRYLVDQVVS